MFELMPPSLIGSYVVFSTFAFYQQLHAKNFRGRSQGLHVFLSFSGFAALLTAITFHVYYGWTVRWYLPILLFIIGFAIQSVWFVIESSLQIRGLAYLWSVLGFIVWPAAATMMFHFIPDGA